MLVYSGAAACLLLYVRWQRGVGGIDPPWLRYGNKAAGPVSVLIRSVSHPFLRHSSPAP